MTPEGRANLVDLLLKIDKFAEIPGEDENSKLKNNLADLLIMSGMTGIGI